MENKNSIFINRLKDSGNYNNNYNYDLVNYKNMDTTVIIIDEYGLKHSITPYSLLKGSKLSIINAVDKTEYFIHMSNIIHNYKYDYSKCRYIKNSLNVTITCNIHGDFQQTPANHLNAIVGCQKCGIDFSSNSNRKNTEEFIKEAIKVHGNRYDYSKTEYISNIQPVIIIDEMGNECHQSPSSHLKGHILTTHSIINKTEYFIKRAKNIHGDKYIYDKVIYNKADSNILIGCREHGYFNQKPSNHLNGKGCSKCSNVYNMTNNDYINEITKIYGDLYDYSLVDFKTKGNKVIIIDKNGFKYNVHAGTFLKGKGVNIKQCEDKTKLFIHMAKETHGDLYDYTQSVYKNAKTKIKIYCRTHGIFETVPHSHINGSGCYLCNRPERITMDVFLERSFTHHGDMYDYSMIKDIKNRNSIVSIICKEHGIFKQSVSSHIQGKKCKKCVGVHKPSTEEIIMRFKEVHGDKYDYSSVNYKSSHTKVTIICKEHGNFTQTPSSHNRGSGCPKCSGNIITTNDFIERSNIIHENRYNYSKSEYIDASTELVVGCDLHGDFMISPQQHYRGMGCKYCTGSISKGEARIEAILNEMLVNFETQKSFSNLKYRGKLRFDFYLPVYNICIEFDGEQHFRPMEYFGGEKSFKEQQKRDKCKTKFCEKNNIKLIRISYKEMDNIRDILYKSIEKL